MLVCLSCLASSSITSSCIAKFASLVASFIKFVGRIRNNLLLRGSPSVHLVKFIFNLRFWVFL
jgi:hypothetical protein